MYFFFFFLKKKKSQLEEKKSSILGRYFKAVFLYQSSPVTFFFIQLKKRERERKNSSILYSYFKTVLYIYLALSLIYGRNGETVLKLRTGMHESIFFFFLN
jgi:hypothetical protein